MDTIYDELSRFSPDGLVHDNERLAELQALPLHRKIGITIARITEWYKAFNGNIYVSLSGGKDSTVLWDITHKLFPDVPAVFSNTGLEYPEIQQFAKSICTDVVSPKMSFTEVIKTYGYPLISKEVSEAIYYARRNTPPDAKQNGNDWSLQATDHKSVVKNIGQANNLEETRTYGAKTRLHKNGLLDNLPPRRTHNLSKENRTPRATAGLTSYKRMCGERCLRVVSLIQMAAKNLPLIKKSGCPSFIFHSKYPTTVAI